MSFIISSLLTNDIYLYFTPQSANFIKIFNRKFEIVKASSSELS